MSRKVSRANPERSGSTAGLSDQWLRGGYEGVVNFRLLIDAEGHSRLPATIQTSTRPKEFDDAVCSIVMKRVRFNPALDANGNRFPPTFARPSISGLTALEPAQELADVDAERVDRIAAFHDEQRRQAERRRCGGRSAHSRRVFSLKWLIGSPSIGVGAEARRPACRARRRAIRSSACIQRRRVAAPVGAARQRQVEVHALAGARAASRRRGPRRTDNRSPGRRGSRRTARRRGRRRCPACRCRGDSRRRGSRRAPCPRRSRASAAIGGVVEVAIAAEVIAPGSGGRADGRARRPIARRQAQRRVRQAPFALPNRPHPRSSSAIGDRRVEAVLPEQRIDPVEAQRPPSDDREV